jgi:hypothetical protein
MAWIKLFNREVKLRPFVLSSTLRKIRGKWRDGKYTGRIVITGKVEITNGPKHAGPYRNHFVDSALQALGYILLTNSYCNHAFASAIAPLNPQTIYLGTNTTISTFPYMNQLVNPIGPLPGTGPNSFSSSYGSITNGYQVVYSATWNPGTVSGTIGEMALYGSAATNYYVGLQGGTEIWESGSVMLSRLSVADGDFSAFTINASYPLIIVWTIQFLFA